MKPLKVLGLVIWGIVAAGVGFGYSYWAVNNGLQIPISGYSLSISVAFIAVVLVILVIPIWKYKKNLKKALEAKDEHIKRSTPIDPFYAVRVLVLAKASALASAMFIGWHSGVLIKQLTAPVVVPEGIVPNVVAGVVSVVLLVVALVVIEICKLPGDGDKLNKEPSKPVIT